MATTSTVYGSLKIISRYLSHEDQLKMRLVCHMWRDVADSNMSWKSMTLAWRSGLEWSSLISCMLRQRTENLTLIDFIYEGNELSAHLFWSCLSQVKSLKKLIFVRCSSHLFLSHFQFSNSLDILQITFLNDDNVDFSFLSNFTNCTEIKISKVNQANLKSGLNFTAFSNLTIFSLTSVDHLEFMSLAGLINVPNLEYLIIGNCTTLPRQFSQNILISLQKLRYLRLENGREPFCPEDILGSVSKMNNCINEPTVINKL